MVIYSMTNPKKVIPLLVHGNRKILPDCSSAILHQHWCYLLWVYTIFFMFILLVIVILDHTHLSHSLSRVPYPHHLAPFSLSNTLPPAPTSPSQLYFQSLSVTCSNASTIFLAVFGSCITRLVKIFTYCSLQKYMLLYHWTHLVTFSLPTHCFLPFHVLPPSILPFLFLRQLKDTDAGQTHKWEESEKKEKNLRREEKTSQRGEKRGERSPEERKLGKKREKEGRN